MIGKEMGMKDTNYVFRQIGPEELNGIRELFTAVFTQAPWNDDWSDTEQLDRLLLDLVGQSNSLTYAMFAGDEMIALSMGRIKHWYTGTEYCIDELCVRTERQGQGVGTLFLQQIESAMQELGSVQIFLHTQRDVPAYHFYRKNDFVEQEGHVSFAKHI